MLKSLKICKKKVQNQTPCRTPFLRPFWDDFGSILDRYWTQHRSESLLDAEKSFSGRLSKITLFLDPFRGGQELRLQGCGYGDTAGLGAPNPLDTRTV